MVLDQEQEQRHHALLRQVTNGLYWLARVADFQPLEFGLGILTLAWVGVLLWPGNLFDVSPRVYVTMATRGTDTTWGYWGASIVVVHLTGAIGTVIDKQHGLWDALRMIGILVTGCWFFYLGCMFAGAGIVSFGAFSHFILASLAAWTLWRYVARPSHDQ